MFKSALYPCVIEFTVKRDVTSVRAGDSVGSSAAMVAPGVLGSGMRAATQVLPDASRASGTVGATGGKGEDAGLVVEDTDVVGSSGAGEGASSWLGTAKAEESSYKVIGGGRRRGQYDWVVML